MSQTNAFAKANNPDYVYLDLQQTNVYNNSINDDVDINFIVTRDTPVIANTGDYTVSVSRFQIDTYKLPTLVVEPDLITQPFDPTRTIHKVALINNEATLPLDPNEYVPSFPLLQTLNITPSVASYTTATASSLDGEYIVASAAQTTNGGIVGNGTIYIWKRGANGDYSVTPIADSVFNNSLSNIYLGLSLDISEDGKWIAVGTSDVSGASSYIVERNTNISYQLTKPAPSVSNVALNQNGTIMVIGYPTASNSGTNRGIIQILRRTGNTTSVIQTINGTTNNIGLGHRVAINGDGSRIIVGSLPSSNVDGTVIVYTNLDPRTTNTWTATTITIDMSVGNDFFGRAVAISHSGTTIAIGSSDENSLGAVSIYDYDTNTSVYVFNSIIVPIDNEDAYGFGSVLALSYDGSEIIVGSPGINSATGKVDIFIYIDATWAHATESSGVGTNKNYGSSVALFNDGRGVVIGSFGNGATPYGSLEVRTFGVTLYTTIPSVIKNHITVESVMWITENPSYIGPPRSGLTGKNSVNFLYYWCDSYARFIGQVNKALYKAYVANFNYIYENWINGLSETQKNIFYNIIGRFYSTPPFLEWSNSELKASLVVNELFNSTEVNYAIIQRLWAVEDGTDYVTDPVLLLPFNFKIAFNASLYALFNSFPATETIIENEKFFIIDFTYPVPNIVNRSLNAIPLYPNYPFLDPYVGFDGALYLPSPIEYPNIGNFIVLTQELSTIDTWCPINGIVFTTNTLPIVINQFSANSSINGERLNPEAGADFALVITDLQTNQQGYKPNLIYTPTAEFRRVDMTGNLGLTNIDIRVFWRAKTGQLLPMKLGSGATASIKLLFQKKLLAERQQLQFQQFSVKDMKI